MSFNELPPSPPENSGWCPIDPTEEAERVERHLGMARSMLSDKDEGRDTAVKISFGRYIEENGLITTSPGECMGILLGIDETSAPEFVIAKYEVWFTEVDSITDDITTEVLIEQADIASIPVREIGEFYGAVATPGTWQFIEGLEGA